jgi:hypothetical protein
VFFINIRFLSFYPQASFSQFFYGNTMAAAGDGGAGAGASGGNGGGGGGPAAVDGVVMTKTLNIKALLDHWQSEVIRLIAVTAERRRDVVAAEVAHHNARRTTDSLARIVRDRVDPARNNDPDDIFIRLTAEALQDEQEAFIVVYYSRIRAVCIRNG